MTDYKSPWWRRDVILTAEEKRNMREQQFILAIICFMTVAIFGLYKLVRYVETEARQAERARIYNMVSHGDKEMQMFITEMERAGRGKK